MKKTTILICVMMTLGASFCLAQSNTLLASNLVEDNANFLDSDPSLTDGSDYSSTSTSKTYDIPEGASTFKMSSPGLLNINVNSNVKYTKAEILSKDSNTTAQTLKLDNSNKSVDISKMNAGTYYMILSNDQGDVFSEKVIIL